MDAAPVAKAGYDAIRAGRVNVIPGVGTKIMRAMSALSPSRRFTGELSGRFVSRHRVSRVIDWERVRQTLATDHTQAPGSGGPNRRTSWLTTTNPDGTSHVRPLGTVQVDGVLYFNSGTAARKSRNIAANPQCVLSIATLRFDLVLEGRAVRVTDTPELNVTNPRSAK